jgi:hypothetical protein
VEFINERIRIFINKIKRCLFGRFGLPRSSPFIKLRGFGSSKKPTKIGFISPYLCPYIKNTNFNFTLDNMCFYGIHYTTKGIVLDLSTNRVYLSGYIVFNENSFPSQILLVSLLTTHLALAWVSLSPERSLKPHLMVTCVNFHPKSSLKPRLILT